MFGIGIGVDLNNSGTAKLPYNATMYNIVAFSFHISGIPAGVTVGVQFPIPATDMSGDAWELNVSADGDYVAELNTMATAQSLKPSFTMTGQPAFDPSMIESVQFHIATNITAAIAVPDSARLCVSNFAAVVKM
jgi:hypothetical protein